MPITPEEARRERSQGMGALLAVTIDKIDKYLSTVPPRTKPRYEWWYDVRDLSGALVNEITKIYMDAGWGVQLESDQRDGDALVFWEKY